MLISKLTVLLALVVVMLFVSAFYLPSIIPSLANYIAAVIGIIFIALLILGSLDLICPFCLSLFSVEKLGTEKVDEYEDEEEEEVETYRGRRRIAKVFAHRYDVKVYETTYRCKKCSKEYSREHKKYFRKGKHLVDVDF